MPAFKLYVITNNINNSCYYGATKVKSLQKCLQLHYDAANALERLVVDKYYENLIRTKMGVFNKEPYVSTNTLHCEMRLSEHTVDVFRIHFVEKSHHKSSMIIKLNLLRDALHDPAKVATLNQNDPNPNMCMCFECKYDYDGSLIL